MRFATFNVDVSEAHLKGRQPELLDIAKLLTMVDVLALQEVGQWDKPLTQEP